MAIIVPIKQRVNSVKEYRKRAAHLRTDRGLWSTSSDKLILLCELVFGHHYGDAAITVDTTGFGERVIDEVIARYREAGYEVRYTFVIGEAPADRVDQLEISIPDRLFGEAGSEP